MSKEVLELEIKSNTKSATKDTKDFGKSLEDINEQINLQNREIVRQERILLKLKAMQEKLSKSGWSAGMPKLNAQIKRTSDLLNLEKNTLKDLKNQQREATQQVKKYNKEQKQTGEISQQTLADFEIMGVSLNSIKKGFGQIIPTAKALFGTIKAGILSTGIGALVLGITAVTQAFKRSEEGQDKFQRLMAAIGAVTSQVLDTFADLGESIINTFTNPLETLEGFGKKIGKFLKNPIAETAAAFTTAKTNVKNFIDETKKEIDAIDEVTKARQKSHKIDRGLRVERAKADRDINDLRLKAEDREKFSATERIKLLREAQQIEENITNKEIKSKKLLVDALILEQEQGKNNKETKDQLAQLQADLINLDTKRLRSQRLLQTQITTATNQEKAEKQALRDAELEDDFQFYRQLSENIQKNKEEEKKAAEKKKQLAKDVENAKKVQAMRGLALITEIAGQESTIGKAAAVASATASGVEGVQNAFTTAQKSAITTVFPAYPFIQAGLAGAFSALQIQKILSGTPAGGGGGGGGGASASVAPATPAPQMMSGAFELGGGLEPEPTRAFVVTDEMTNSQNQLANIRRRATI